MTDLLSIRFTEFAQNRYFRWRQFIFAHKLKRQTIILYTFRTGEPPKTVTHPHFATARWSLFLFICPQNIYRVITKILNYFFPLINKCGTHSGITCAVIVGRASCERRVSFCRRRQLQKRSLHVCAAECTRRPD